MQQKKQKKRLLWIICSIVAVLILAAGAYWFVSSVYLQKSPQKASDNSKDENTIVPETFDEQYSRLLNDGDYPGAKKLLESRLSKDGKSASNSTTYYALAQLALQFGDIKAAETYSEKLLSLKPDSSTSYVTAAYVAKAKGDKAKAVSYMQQAIDKLDKSKPQYDMQKGDYETIMRGME